MILLAIVFESEFPDTQRQTAISSRFSSVVHKKENYTKSPRSLSNTGSAGFCMRGGQKVVAVDKKRCGKKNAEPIYDTAVDQLSKGISEFLRR